ncbi:MAG: hypothetical protein R2822_14560 [Spirosomataceae bacterium]
MKSLLVFISLIFGMNYFDNGTLPTANPTNKSASVSSANLIGVEVEVGFGRASRNCRGLGICKIVASGSLVIGGEEGGVKAIANLTPTETISFNFLKSDLSTNQLKLFAGEKFKIEEDCRVERGILATKGPLANKVFTIQKGEYNIKNNGNTIILENVLVSS